MGDKYRIDPVMEEELTQIIKEIVGAEEVMWDKQDAYVDDIAAVKPELKDFVVLSFLSGPAMDGYPEYTPAESGEVGMFDTSSRFLFTISTNVYTNEAHLLKIMKIASALKTYPYLNRMRKVGLNLLNTGGEGDFSKFDETRFNLRSHIDLYFSYISVEKDINLGSIEYFEASGKLGNIDSEVKVHKNAGIL